MYKKGQIPMKKCNLSMYVIKFDTRKSNSKLCEQGRIEYEEKNACWMVLERVVVAIPFLKGSMLLHTFFNVKDHLSCTSKHYHEVEKFEHDFGVIGE